MKNLGALIAALALSSVASFSEARGQTPPHYAAAVELLNEITTLQALGIFTDSQGVPLNRYGGSWSSKTDPSYIRFADLDHGVPPANNTKCSPLVTHLLKTVYGWNWKNYTFIDPLLGSPKSVASPTPYQYIQLVKEGKGFAQRVMTLDEVQPGDILSWWTIGADSGDHT